MGVHSLLNHSGKRSLSKGRLGRLKKKAGKRKADRSLGPVDDDSELMSLHHLKKKCENPKSNHSLSGKKRRKLLKQIRHMQSESSKDETQVAEPVIPKKKRKVSKDVEMKDASSPGCSSQIDSNKSTEDEMQD